MDAQTMKIVLCYRKVQRGKAVPRLFIAIDLPLEVKAELGKLCSGISGAKWVKDDQMHLTLRFIGETGEQQFKQVRDALAGIEGASFEMSLESVGQFPERGSPRVLWVGLKAPNDLRQLQQTIETTLLNLDLDPQDKPFSPHITLARFKTPPAPESMRQYLRQHMEFRSTAIPVKSFILYSSLLQPHGPVYRCEGVYDLST
jgi:2'-5' RNA ligase